MAKAATAKNMDEQPGDPGIDVDLSNLIADLSELNQSKAELGSENGKHRAKIKGLLDQRGYNPKGLSMLQKIFDIRKPADRLDVLRTLARGLPIVMEHYGIGEDLVDQMEDSGNVTKMTQPPQ